MIKTKKKVVLVALNSRYSHSCLALLYMRSLLETRGEEYGFDFDIVLLEKSVNMPRFDLISSIVVEKPDFVLFSVYIWNSEFVRAIVPELARLIPGAVVACGGPEVTYNADSWAAYFDSVALVGREGALLSFIEKGMAREPICIRGEHVAFADVPFPYKLDDLARYERNYIYYETSRGCPCSCSYCLSSSFDQDLEYRQLDQVYQELDFFMQNRVRTVKLVDRTFNADPKRARKIWDYIITRNTCTNFHFEIQPLLLQEEDFDLLAKVPKNLFRFELGIQSCNEKTLREINRPVHIERSLEAAKRLIKETKLHVHVDLIAGLPYEDLPSLHSSFDRVYALGADHFQLGFLKLLHGTKMQKNSKDYEIEAASFPPYQVYSTKWLSFDKMLFVEKIENLLEVLYNSGNFAASLVYIDTLYESPFAFYTEFAHFIEENALFLSKNSFEKGASALLLFSDSSRLQREGLADALFYDYARRNNATRAPSVLSFFNENSRETQTQFEAYLAESKTQFDLKQYKKRLLCYRPTSLFLKLQGISACRGICFVTGYPEEICWLGDFLLISRGS